MTRLETKDHGSIYYEVHGQGQPVLFLHGWSGRHDNFDETVKVLSRETQCITMDFRGHGLSMDVNNSHVTIEDLAEDVHALLKHLDVENVCIVAWSMGVYVLLSYMHQFGTQRISQCVFVDMTPKTMNDASWNLGFFQGRYTKEQFELDQIKMKEDFLDFMVKFALEDDPSIRTMKRTDVEKICQEILSHCHIGCLQSLFISMADRDERTRVQELDVPLSYIYAIPGSLMKPELAAYYQNHCPSFQKAYGIEEASHELILEKPTEFTACIQEILKGGSE